MNHYPHIFAPGKIGSVEVRNRTVMSAMGTNMSDHGFVNDAIINHYVERAKGGVGLIIIEVTCVDTPLGFFCRAATRDAAHAGKISGRSR